MAPPEPIDLFGIVLASLGHPGPRRRPRPRGARSSPSAAASACWPSSLAAKDAPPTAATVMAAAGSFAAISTLLGSPILGAFLLMEASGLGGPLLGLVLVPGLLAAGVGTLIFIGLDNLTGLGTFSLAIPGLPAFSHPTGAMFAWGLAIGVVAAFLGTAIRLGGLALQARGASADRLVVPRWPAWWWPAAPSAFFEITGKSVRVRPLLRPEPAARPRAPGRHLDRRRPGRPGRGQGDRLRRLALGVPRRARLPVDVHRRAPSAWPAPTCRAWCWCRPWPWGSAPWPR